MASVSLDFKFFSDARIKVLSRALGLDHFGVRGRCMALYHHCVEECVHTISGVMIDAIADLDGFAEAMVQAKLASRFEWCEDGSEGPALPEGEYRIRGTKGRVEYLGRLRNSSKSGGDARAKSAERGEGGRFKPAGQPIVQPVASHPAGHLPADTPAIDPAEASASTSSSASSSASNSKQRNKTIATGSPSADAEPEGPTPTAQTWRAYRDAFAARYRAKPPWNSKTGGQLKQFVSRIGADEAPLVAAFYLLHGGYRYVSAGHSVGLLLQDAEKLRTEWATSTIVTDASARKTDHKQAVLNTFGRRIAEAEAREAGDVRDEQT